MAESGVMRSAVKVLRIMLRPHTRRAFRALFSHAARCPLIIVPAREV